MKCFTHQTEDAIGLCARCSRALCPACAGEADGVLACKDQCEDELRQREKLTLLKKQQGERYSRAFGITMGGFFGLALAIGGGYAIYTGWREEFSFYYFPGGAILALGLLMLAFILKFALQKKSEV